MLPAGNNYTPPTPRQPKTTVPVYDDRVVIDGYTFELMDDPLFHDLTQEVTSLIANQATPLSVLNFYLSEPTPAPGLSTT